MSTSTAYKHVIGGKLKLKRPLNATSSSSARSSTPPRSSRPAATTSATRPTATSSPTTQRNADEHDDRKEKEQDDGPRDDTRAGEKRQKTELVQVRKCSLPAHGRCTSPLARSISHCAIHALLCCGCVLWQTNDGKTKAERDFEEAQTKRVRPHHFQQYQRRFLSLPPLAAVRSLLVACWCVAMPVSLCPSGSRVVCVVRGVLRRLM